MNGTAPMLRLLDEGLADDATRATAGGLLRKLTWAGLETYAQCLSWLRSTVPAARGIAGLLLAQDGRLFDVPRAVLRDAIRTQLEAMVGPLQISWNALRDNPDAMRLLQGLWAHGWRDALITLWLGEQAQINLNQNHPDIAAADPEDAVRLLLGQARFGQALIPVMLTAAELLAELHRARRYLGAGGDPPHRADIAQVQGQILRELAEFAADSGRSPRTTQEADAAILHAALRRWPIIPPSDPVMLAMLADSDDDVTWFWAASRLADTVANQAAVQDAITTALTDIDPRRRGLALLVLLVNPSLLAVMRDTLADDLRRPGLDTNRGLLLACLLISADVSDDSANSWLTATVSQHVGMVEDVAQSAATLAQRMLVSIGQRARAVAAAQLLGADLYALLVPILTEAALAGDDWLREEAEQWLFLISNELPTDGSTVTIDWLYRQLTSSNAYGRSREGAGQKGTLLIQAVSAIRHTNLYWVAKWMATIDLDGGDEIDFLHASQALDGVRQASDEVIHWVCERLTQNGHSEIVRRGAMLVLGGIRHDSINQMENAEITAALITALEDPAPTVRRASAFALQWTNHEVHTVSTALLWHAENDPDQQTRSLALVSLGRFLRRLQPSSEISAETPDPFAHPWLHRMRVLVGGADPAISRAAAGSIAAALEGRDDATALLSAFLPDQSSVLTAMLLGAADNDLWDEGEPPSHHASAASRITTWLYEQPEQERAQLINLMLSDLERAAAGMEADQLGNVFDEYMPRWTTRRIITGVLADLSERLTYHSFIRSRPLVEVISLLVRMAKDPDSYNVRRFALKILGNLQRFTPDVAAAFFEACKDASPVYHGSKAVIRKFNDFAPGSFEKLTQALFDPAHDASVSFRAATLLGALGVGRSDELGSSGRSQIGNELARFLANPLADRIAVERIGAEEFGGLQILVLQLLFPGL